MSLASEQKLERYLNFLEQDPKNINLLIDIIHSYTEMKDFKQAKYYAQKVKAINQIVAINLEANIKLNEGNYNEAAQLYTKVLTNEDNPLTRYYLGLCYLHMKEFNKALTTLKPLIQKQNIDAMILSAKILYRQDLAFKAISLLDEVLSIHTQHAAALALKALILFDTEQTREAKILAKQAMESNPNLYETQLVDVLTTESINETHLEKIESLLKIDPNETRLWFTHGYTLLTQFKISEAEASFNKAITIYPDYFDAWISIALCQLLQDKNQQALCSCERAVEILPEAGEGWGGIALVHALIKDFQTANIYLQKSINLNPDNIMSQLAEIMILNKDNPKQAKENFNNIFGQNMQDIKKIFDAHLFTHTQTNQLH